MHAALAATWSQHSGTCCRSQSCSKGIAQSLQTSVWQLSQPLRCKASRTMGHHKCRGYLFGKQSKRAFGSARCTH